MPTPDRLFGTTRPHPRRVALLACVGVGAAGVGHAFDAAPAVLQLPASGLHEAFPIAEMATALRWQAARSHATGQGAERDDWKAFQIYARIAAMRFAGEPSRDDAPYVGAAMREMGRYYLSGIEGSPVAADPRRGEDYLYRAAALFGDADAQFELGRFYLDSRWGKPRRRHAARWFALAARKGSHRARAELGVLLCEGNGVARDPVRGILFIATALRDAPEVEREGLGARLAAAFDAVSDAEREKVEGALRRADLPPMVSVGVADGS